MSGEEETWAHYQAEIREFDAVLEHAKAVSNSLAGLTPPSRSASYGEQIFVKLLAHCIILRRLAPDPQRETPNEFWDVPSLSAVARCAIEAHDAFEYIADNAISDEERDLRLVLWELHDKTRRLRMLEAIGSADPRNDGIRDEAAQLETRLKSHVFYGNLRLDIRRKIEGGDPPAFHLSQRERCSASGVNFDYYNAVTMQLSQHVHTLPFSVHQLFEFRAGTPDALRLMTLPLRFVLPFLVRVTDSMSCMFPGKTPLPQASTARLMTMWRDISTHGVKSPQSSGAFNSRTPSP